MRSPLTEPRRPNLATIVGSGLAVAAAGSLLVFSSLAEQAGLQGLATGGLQPATPGRDGGTRAITISAPASSPTPEQTLRELVAQVDSDEPAPRAPVTPAAPAPERDRPPRPDENPVQRERSTDPALAARAVAPSAPAYAAQTDPAGPPYGKAKGHDKHAQPEKANATRRPKANGRRSPEAPVYARTRSTGGEKPKAPKMKKVTKGPAARTEGNGHHKHAQGHGKARGHGKHARGHGKARGRGKHAHGHGKGKGHSKHGH